MKTQKTPRKKGNTKENKESYFFTIFFFFFFIVSICFPYFFPTFTILTISKKCWLLNGMDIYIYTYVYTGDFSLYIDVYVSK